MMYSMYIIVIFFIFILGFIFWYTVGESDLIPIISITVLLFLLIVTTITGACDISSLIHEQEYYAQTIAERESIVAALNKTEDIVNTDLYLRAVDFNKNLSLQQAKYERGGYVKFSGKYDWSAIDKVPLD